MHRLLQRQLRRHLGPGHHQEAHWQPLLAIIDQYYQEVDQERSLLENAMTVSSSELSEATAHARREHAMLRGVMDSIPDLIFFKTNEGRYLGCNKAFEDFLQKPEAEVIGQSDFDLVPTALARQMLERDQEVLRTRTKHLTERWVTEPKTQHKICLEVLSTPYFDLDGKLLGLIGIARNITARKEAEETIYRQAHYDALTALPNRRYFHDRLAHEIQLSHRTQLPAALMLIDLDRFKEVNDLLGHAAGDSLLIEAAQRIAECVRETDTVARLGGDEFTVVVPGLREAHQAEQIAQKIIERMALPFKLGSETACVSASIGIALYPSNAQDMDSLIKNADQAMYVAKSHGRNRFSAFTDVLHEATLTRQRRTAEIRAAVASGQIAVHYLPVVDLQTGDAVMAEALVRWQHPQDGLLSPGEFLSMAEETGCLAEITACVFDDATRWVRQWRTTVAPTFQVGINLQAAQFRGPQDLALHWTERLATLALPGEALAIDITEDFLMKMDATLEQQLHRLREAGIGLAVDDYGIGYSSLALLKRLDVRCLKIDISLVAQLEADPSAQMLCLASIAMAHELGMKVVAEGVATEGQRAWLASAGCDLGQGYLWGPPLPATQLDKRLNERTGAVQNAEPLDGLARPSAAWLPAHLQPGSPPAESVRR